MIGGRTILCFASGYDAPPTSKHHLMNLLARDNCVLWVNYHASRRLKASRSDLRHLRSRLGNVFAGILRAGENLYVMTPLLAPLPANRWVRTLNRTLVTLQIRRALSRISRGPLQVWSFSPDVAYLLDGLEAERVVYYCVDDFASFSGYDRRQVLRDEAELCRRADLVVTTSRALLEAKGPLNKRTIMVSHGVDYEHFARAVTEPLSAPGDIAAIPPPRIGFFGLIRDWVDLELVAAVARRRRLWQFVFIGDCAVNLSGLAGQENIHFLGPRPYSQLPAYSSGFAAAIIPFKINALTRSANPIKLREYLAAGLGVVSTPLPEVQACGDLVEIADGAEAFESAIEKILSQDDQARHRRLLAMREETWPHKLDRICRCLMAADRQAIA